jgi:hypothetical protein
MELALNGQLLKTCTGAAPCEATAGPFNTAGTTLTFTATAWDLQNATSTARLDVIVQTD